MNRTIHEKAIEALHDYAIYLRDQGDFSDLNEKQRAAKKSKENKPPSRAETEQQYRAQISVEVWENEKIRQWRECGRLTSDGTLKLVGEEYNRWSLKRIQRAFPELNKWDRWAALIIVDGVFTREEMAKDPHENIREVIEQIVEVQIKRHLSKEISSIFQEVLTRVQESAPIPFEELSSLRAGERKIVHRVRHPETGELVSQEEREEYLKKNPDPKTVA